jgi:hypothetical protein
VGWDKDLKEEDMNQFPTPFGWVDIMVSFKTSKRIIE